MDLVGPVTESVYGNKYFLTILDVFSRYGWVIFLMNKSDTFNKFYEWFNLINNKYNKRIKYLRTDNGLEFCNNKFKHFCSIYGIQHQLTVPYSPQQNGKVERLNGILITSSKAMLTDARLSRQFWEDAVATSNYIHNRLPHSSLNNKIPYEIITKSKVDYSNIKVFCCRVFFFVPKSFRSKFENNALPDIFLGYFVNPSAYKILDTSNNRIMLSRSVEFFETFPGDTSLIHHPSSPINFLPNSKIRGNDNNNNYYNSNSYIENFHNSQYNNSLNIQYPNENTHTQTVPIPISNISKTNKRKHKKQHNDDYNLIKNNTNIIDNNTSTNVNNTNTDFNNNSLPTTNNNEIIETTHSTISANDNETTSENNHIEANNINCKFTSKKQIPTYDKPIQNMYKNTIHEINKHRNKRIKGENNHQHRYDSKKSKRNGFTKEPKTFKDIYNAEDKDEWLKTINEEL